MIEDSEKIQVLGIVSKFAINNIMEKLENLYCIEKENGISQFILRHSTLGIVEVINGFLILNNDGEVDVIGTEYFENKEKYQIDISNMIEIPEEESKHIFLDRRFLTKTLHFDSHDSPKGATLFKSLAIYFEIIEGFISVAVNTENNIHSITNISRYLKSVLTEEEFNSWKLVIILEATGTSIESLVTSVFNEEQT